MLASKKRVRVPLDHAAEMVAHDPSMGEFRVHYAGFFDPGFGYGTNGEIPGTKAVLEVRAYEVPIVLEDDHLVGRLHYYRMSAIPSRVYGSSIGSSYQQQGLALSKQFKRQDIRSSAIAKPAPVLTSALYSRFSSRGLDDFADRVLSAMRKQFGGHAEKAPG